MGRERHVYTRVTCTHLSHVHTCHVYTRVTTCPVQAGGGYPGSGGCNDVIPHAKWHAQTAASLADMTRLMDFVLMLERRHTAHAQ